MSPWNDFVKKYHNENHKGESLSASLKEAGKLWKNEKKGGFGDPIGKLFKGKQKGTVNNNMGKNQAGLNNTQSNRFNKPPRKGLFSRSRKNGLKPQGMSNQTQKPKFMDRFSRKKMPQMANQTPKKKRFGFFKGKPQQIPASTTTI
jgi:hypothetical protein